MSSQCIGVLIIEDNPGDARLVQEALKGATAPSFTVEWVDRLSIGLARLAEGGVDVLLLDLGLPDSQGLEALALIRALAPTVPVVVLSGADDEQFAVEAVQAGAQDYLVKAYANPHLLTRALRYAIERKRADEALRESEERLRLAMTAANEAIWEYNPATGFALWNRNIRAALRGGAPETWCPAELGTGAFTMKTANGCRGAFSRRWKARRSRGARSTGYCAPMANGPTSMTGP